MYGRSKECFDVKQWKTYNLSRQEGVISGSDWIFLYAKRRFSTALEAHELMLNSTLRVLDEHFTASQGLKMLEAEKSNHNQNAGLEAVSFWNGYKSEGSLFCGGGE